MWTHNRPQGANGHFFMIFGRTELTIDASRAKNCEEVAIEVHSSVDAPKLGQKGVKRFPRPKNLADFFFPLKIELMGIV